MTPSTGEISFTSGSTEVVINAPEFGYTTELKFPWDFIRLDNGTIEARDEGTKYDKRSCSCECYLTPAQQGALNTLINSTARGQSLILSLPTGCGFFPFGPDKGDDGPFTVALQLRSTPAIQQAPFKYFRCQLIMTHAGTYPAYSLPTQVADGPWTIGNVTQLRMPPTLFSPTQIYGISVAFTENNSPRYFNRGSGADYASTQFNLTCNESKAAALVYDLASVQRVGSILIATGDNFYAYGADHSSSASYNVRMKSDMIVIKHNRYNEFELSLDLQRISDA